MGVIIMCDIISEVVKNIAFEGEFVEAMPYGCGHINDTYTACFKKESGEFHRYILQRINNKVFKEPEKLMENIQGVTEFLQKKIINNGGDPLRETLTIILTVEGESYYKSSQGDYWRGYIFIEDAETYQIVESTTDFYNAGKAFGTFQMLLNDYPAHKLHETIPNFHHTAKRYSAFEAALKNDVMNRAKDIEEEIKFVKNRVSDTSVIVDMLKEGQLPLRVTHNDTKYNNVMIDNGSRKGLCVIDLDTVMPGSSLYDFGDSIRFGTNTAAEDEKDLSKVWMDIELFESFTKGFMESAGESLTKKEIELLPLSAKIMTLECGIRFLTDYLNGDTYFKIHREGHNLDRARTQFKLVADMEEKYERMKEVVMKYEKEEAVNNRN